MDTDVVFRLLHVQNTLQIMYQKEVGVYLLEAIKFLKILLVEALH
jgi:hypothetical protein